MRSLVAGHGFTDVQQDGWTIMVRKGDTTADHWTTVWEIIGKTLVADGIIPQEHYDLLSRIFVDTELDYPLYTLFCAWGRKPN
jgi:hypothetical protein